MLLSGNPTLLRWLDVSKDNTQTLLDKELSKLVSEFENKKIAADSTMQQTMPEATKKSGNSPAKMKRQKLRRARTKNGLLISSLRKKIYHCNCIDCQAKRKSQGKPAYLEPIGKLYSHFKNMQIEQRFVAQILKKWIWVIFPKQFPWRKRNREEDLESIRVWRMYFVTRNRRRRKLIKTWGKLFFVLSTN